MDGGELSAENGYQPFIPVGFAHGFVMLEPSAEVTYKVSDVYAPAHDGGILWNDPQIGIDWPSPEGIQPTLSPKDEKLRLLPVFDSPFDCAGIPMQLTEARAEEC